LANSAWALAKAEASAATVSLDRGMGSLHLQQPFSTTNEPKASSKP